MFQKLVAVGSIGFTTQGEEQLQQLAKETVFYRDIPSAEEELIRRMQGADAVLVSFTSAIGRRAIEACPALRYIGMCCSLYSEESANVDIAAAREQGVVVTGIRDYGDNGVAEYLVAELTYLLHGFGGVMWRDLPEELYGQKIGIIGMGTTGRMAARAFQFFGAEVSYYSRTRKPDAEAEGFAYLSLDELLQTCDILSTHLNRNTILLHEREFALIGEGKILTNTAIGPCFDLEAIETWLQKPNTYYLCDRTALTPETAGLERFPNVLCANKGSGGSVQATQRLMDKVLANLRNYLQNADM